MVGILIATHGGFAEGLLSAVELIAGKQEKVETVGLYHGDGVDEFEGKITAAMDKLDDGDGVLVFVDILGGNTFKHRYALLFKKRPYQSDCRNEYGNGCAGSHDERRNRFGFTLCRMC